MHIGPTARHVVPFSPVHRRVDFVSQRSSIRLTPGIPPHLRTTFPPPMHDGIKSEVPKSDNTIEDLILLALDYHWPCHQKLILRICGPKRLLFAETPGPRPRPRGQVRHQSPTSWPLESNLGIIYCVRDNLTGYSMFQPKRYPWANTRSLST